MLYILTIVLSALLASNAHPPPTPAAGAITHCPQFAAGDGEPGKELYFADVKGSDCPSHCLKQKEKTHAISAVTVRNGDLSVKGCWCQIHATYNDGDKRYQTCFFEAINTLCPQFTAGDGEPGKELHFADVKGSDCASHCLKQKEKTPAISAVTVRNGDLSKKGCWCQVGATYNDGDKRYQTCFLPQQIDVYPQNYKPLSGKCTNKLTVDEHSYQVCFNDKIKQFNPRGKGYILGLAVKQKWSIADDGKDTGIYYDGDQCGSKKREVKMKMLCGASFKVTKAEEPATCEYYLEVEAREACKAECAEYNIEYLGSNVAQSYGVSSWQRCSQLCRENERCRFWAWTNGEYKVVKARKGCFMMQSSDAGKRVNDNVVSGADNCNSDTTQYITLVNKYPQNAMVSSFCPAGSSYSRHVCGSGARTWRGKRSVQYGPFTTDKFLSDKRPGHCGCCCDCNSVTVECRKHSSAAIWGQWSAYSSCSKSCGQGVHKRTRTCLHGRTDCVGEKEETKSCKVKICEYTTHYITLVNKYPQNAMVSSFCPAGSSYSRHVCGSHARTWRGKSSVQYGPFTTDKFLSDKRPGHCGCCCDCNSVTVECRKHSSAAIWGKWSAYSSCSKSCGQGVHKRTRTCLHGRTDCVGQKEETRSCKVKICDYPTRYVTLVNKYPQNAMASSLCPVGYLLSRHVCGQGARTWRGKGSVQYGPFTTDKFLSDKRPGHCGCCCDCNSVTLECRK